MARPSTRPASQFLSSGARTLSPGQLRFHTDRCDVVGLLCVRQAVEGGVSKLASSATVYNEMLKRRPDLHALLCKPIPRSRFGEEAGGEHVAYDLPVFGVRDGKLTSHFSLTYIENAQMLPGVRKLTDAEHEAHPDAAGCGARNNASRCASRPATSNCSTTTSSITAARRSRTTSAPARTAC